MIQRKIQIAEHVMVELNKLGFARPLATETMQLIRGSRKFSQGAQPQTRMGPASDKGGSKTLYYYRPIHPGQSRGVRTHGLPLWIRACMLTVSKNTFFCLFMLLSKLTRNKNARKFYLAIFFPVASYVYTCILCCILCIRGQYFSITYTTFGHITITAQNARARRALQPRMMLFDSKIC